MLLPHFGSVQVLVCFGFFLFGTSRILFSLEMNFGAFWVLGRKKEFVGYRPDSAKALEQHVFTNPVPPKMFEEVFLSPCSNLPCTITFLTPSLLVNDSLHPTVILSAVTNAALHLWRDPNRCFWSFSHLLLLHSRRVWNALLASNSERTHTCKKWHSRQVYFAPKPHQTWTIVLYHDL